MLEDDTHSTIRRSIAPSIALALERSIRLTLIFVCLLASTQTCQPQEAAVENGILTEATFQAGNVWSQLQTVMGLPATDVYDSTAASRAYSYLTAGETLNRRVTDYTSHFGIFMHLVKQAVMINATEYDLDAPPWNLTSTPLSLAVYRGFEPSHAFTTLSSLNSMLDNGSPVDPNILQGPIFAQYSANLPPADPFSYTISTFNDGTAASEGVAIGLILDPSLKQIDTFAMSEITWQGNTLYPVSYASTLSGPYTSLTPPNWPIPAVNKKLYYRFTGYADGMFMERDSIGTTFIWYLPWTLPYDPNVLGESRPAYSASVSYWVEPVPPGSTHANAYQTEAEINYYIKTAPYTLKFYTKNWSP